MNNIELLVLFRSCPEPDWKEWIILWTVLASFLVALKKSNQSSAKRRLEMPGAPLAIFSGVREPLPVSFLRRLVRASPTNKKR